MFFFLLSVSLLLVEGFHSSLHHSSLMHRGSFANVKFGQQGLENRGLKQYKTAILKQNPQTALSVISPLQRSSPVAATSKISPAVGAKKGISFSKALKRLMVGGMSFQKSLNVGDVRNSPHTLIFNSLGVMLWGILPIFLLGIYFHRSLSNRYLSRMEREVRREREYREVIAMYSHS